LYSSRNQPVNSKLRAITVLTLFLTFDLVLFGSFTRLTDSGLGCPDWPGCYGSASPIGAVAHIDAAQTAMPTGPVTHSKAWIEMIHRYLAMAVGFLILVLALSSTWQRWKGQFSFNGAWQVKPFWAWLTLFWVCMQGAFGALTVTLKLSPAIVTLHLLGGIGLLVLLSAQVAWKPSSQRQTIGKFPPPTHLGCCCFPHTSNCFWRLGQHQLRRAGVHWLSRLQWPVVASLELPRF